VTLVRIPREIGCALVLALFLQENLYAGEYRKSARIQAGGYYTSNVCLVDNNEESKPVGTFTPSVSVDGGGARSSLRVRVEAEYNSLADSSVVCPEGVGVGNLEAWVPNANLYADLEVVENWLDIYLSAVGTQTPVNPFRVGGDDNANGLGNTNVIYGWTTGARVDRALPNALQLQLEYAYNEQYNSVDLVVGDSQEHRASFDIGTDPLSQRVSVGSRGQYSEIDFDRTATSDEFTNRLSRVEVYAGVLVQRALRLEASLGVEDNVIIVANDGDTDGAYWDVGLRWAPTERTNFSIGYGERFFGAAPRFSVDHRRKRSFFQATYLRDVQFPRNIRTDVGDVTQDQTLSPPVTDVPGLPLEGLAPPTFAANTPVLNESFQLRYQVFGRRSDLEIVGRLSEQTQLSNEVTADFQSVRAKLTRQMSTKITGSIGATWRTSEGAQSLVPGTGFADLEAWTFDLGMKRRLQPQTDVSLRYSFSQSESDQIALNNFEEHRITVLFTWSF